MPKILVINRYQISVWSNENGEPIHVYVSKKKPTPNSTNLWLLSNGKFIIAHNKSKIPDKDLNAILLKLNSVFDMVKNNWIAYHGYEKYIK